MKNCTEIEKMILKISNVQKLSKDQIYKNKKQNFGFHGTLLKLFDLNTFWYDSEHSKKDHIVKCRKIQSLDLEEIKTYLSRLKDNPASWSELFENRVLEKLKQRLIELKNVKS